MWDDDKLIDRCRQNYYMRDRATEESAWSVPSPRYNRGRCDDPETHIVGEVTMRHVCSHCSMNGFENPHTLRACNQRKGATASGYHNKPAPDNKKDQRSDKYSVSAKSESNSEFAKN